ncbi:MAG: CHASE2 domain-containing protein [Phycisphaerae bacterium]
MLRRNQQTNAIGLLIGLLATATVLFVYLSGALDWLEFRTLDLRFRSEAINPIPFSDQLVSIDIDDRSLELVGRWPWSRDVQAALIRIPAECGARAILVDLDWNEPENPRPEHGFAPSTLNTEDDGPRLAMPNLIYPDQVLRGAIARAGNVFPAFHNYHTDQFERAPVFSEAVAHLLAGEEVAARTAIATMHDRFLPATELSAFDRVEVAATLLREPAASADEIATQLSLPLDMVRGLFGRLREAAYRLLLRSWLDADPARYALPAQEILQQLYAYVRGEAMTATTQTPQLAALDHALNEVLSVHFTVRPPLIAPGVAREIAHPVEGMGPVYFPLAEYAARPGFVNFSPSHADNVMRTETLLESYGEAFVAQLAFAVGCEVLHALPDSFSLRQTFTQNRFLEISPPGAAPLRIQLDDLGRAVVPWLPIERMPLTQDRFLPASLFVEVQEKEDAIEQNRRSMLDAIATLQASAFFGPSEEKLPWLDDARAAADEFRAARMFISSTDYASARSAYDLAFTRLNQELDRARLPRSNAESEVTTPEDLAIDAELEFLDEARRANVQLYAQVGALRDRLRARIEEKICLIGYTATSLADMKPTPVSRSMPGVRAHLNMLNGMLTGHMVSWMSTLQVGVWTVIAGFLMSALTVVHRRRALLWLVLGSGLTIAVAAFLFHRDTYWLPVVPILGALFLSYAGIALYQYGFVDRERRALTKTLGQYTSATLARKMAEQPELCQKAETREVTAMFTDLAGFTSISEEIGAERTQRVLNVSLGSLTEVMLQHEAMINKFIGDGVFVFWNPVIHPQEDHAQRACHTALELFEALDRVAADMARNNGDEVFSRLRLRVGIATGNAVVGPCGSEQKYDYTCIGDSVNIAARLESANKFYGTRILVSGPTRDAVGDAFEFRTLGAVQVKGKSQAVPIYELIGKRGTVDNGTLNYARTFSRAIDAFQSRDWPAAIRDFRACAEMRPDDRAAIVYLEAADAASLNAPAADWNGALALIEK